MTKKDLLSRLYRHGVQLMAVGIITGISAGIVVTFFNIAAELFSKYAKDLYALVRENPAFIPLLFIALAIIAFAIATLAKFVPMVRGSGIPQTEGAARGLLELKWYKSLPSMAAACLVCIISGLTAGAEGPSMFIGATCGDGVSKMLRCTDMERRYQLTGGASAGLAVAFNAPLTGIVFAFEEAHRRFTPAIFICAFSSVLSAIITRNVLFELMHMEVASTFTTFTLVQMPLKSYGYVAIAAVLSGLLGFGFYSLCLLSRKIFAKITFAKGLGKMLIPFLAAGVFGLISVAVMGGGHSFIQSLGTSGATREQTAATIFSSPRRRIVVARSRHANSCNRTQSRRRRAVRNIHSHAFHRRMHRRTRFKTLRRNRHGRSVRRLHRHDLHGNVLCVNRQSTHNRNRHGR